MNKCIRVSWISLIAVLIIDCASPLPLSDFYSFGQISGDLQFSKIHRAASQLIRISPRFPYFNRLYSGISVSSHGYLSFNERTALLTPVGFPFSHRLLSVICPFWGSVDQSVSGTTYYRSISSSSQIDEEIRKYFSYANDFTTKWALIATWERVGYYNKHADKVNTFQVVVATNGSQSYAIFNYLDNGIQWSSADNTGGVNGIGPFGVQVGFNGGDGVHFFVRPETQSDSILQLDDNSNVCVPGKYVFRIDGETVQPGRCVNIKPDICSEKVYIGVNPELIVSNVSNIVSVDLDTSVVDQYGGIHCYLNFGVDYDLVNRVIYWSEVALGLIRRVSFDNSFNGSAVETIVTGLSRPEQIAVDWVNRKLYWTDHGRRVIERSDLDGRNIELFFNETYSQAIAIDPFHKTIYWTDLQARLIERAPMTGQFKHSIVSVANPSGLTIDYDNNLLYWTDRDFNQILSCDLGGNNIKVIPVSVVITNPYAITVFKSNLYWTDRTNSSIYIVDQFTGEDKGNISAHLNQPTDVHVLDFTKQPGVLHPFIIKDTFTQCLTVIAPDSFTISVEFVGVCMDFNITWLLNGNLITDDFNHEIVISDLSKSRYRTSVKIMRSSERDFGNYTVTIMAATGSDSANINVKIIDECTTSAIQDPYLLFTDQNSITRINLNGSDQLTVVSNVVNIHGMDVDILTNMVYWCEVDTGNIYRANIDYDGRELIVSGLVNPEEVAIDWISRKLYWCDFGNNTIEYSRLDGTDRTLLINTGLDQPRGLLIDPLSGHIYWTDWGAFPKIEKMTLSGSNRHEIVNSDLLWPNGLTIDYETSRLYWVDAGFDRIETSDLEGFGRTVFLSVPHPFGITVYNSILYWTDWQMRTVASANSNDRTTLRNITHGLRPSNIHTVHSSMQPGALFPYIIKDLFIQSVNADAPYFILSVEFISVCDNFVVTWQFDGRLITNNTKYVITLSVIKQSHYKAMLKVQQISEDDEGNFTVTITSTTGSVNTNISVSIIDKCTPFVIQDTSLLFTDYYSIQRINLNGSNQHTVVSNVVNIHGMDVDILTNMVYWCEVDTGNIYRANIDYDGRELIVSGLIHPEEVAIDWISRKLYWCDFGNDTIEYSRLDGTDRTLLINTGLDQPRGLLIDPLSGHIYWTDWGAFPKIEKMTLSGSNRHEIVNSDLLWPNGLTIDYETSRLYWVDAGFDRIETSDLEGFGRTVFLSVPHPFGITVYNGILYWTDWQMRTVVSANSNDSTTLRNITRGLRPSNIHTVHSSMQPGAFQSVEIQPPETFTLSVEFIAACDSYVIWKFDEQNITNDTNYIITIRRIKQFYYKALLEVKQSSKDDAGNYTVTIMSTAGNYNVNILVSITESDTVFFSPNSYSVVENAGLVQLVLVLNNPLSTAIVVQINNIDGSATGGIDYISGPYSVTLPPGVTTASFDIPITDDNAVEGDEDIKVEIIASSLPNGVNVGDGQATITIIDDDAVRIAVNVSFNQTLYNTSETDESAQITLILSNPLSTDIAVEVFNTNITACGESVDYDSGPYSITFPAGVTSVTFDIPVTDDNISEANETFKLAISSSSLPATVTCAEPCNATVTIADNDGGTYQNCCLGDNTYIFIGNGTKIEKSVLSLTGDAKSNWQTITEANSHPLGIDVDITTCTLFYSVGSRSTNQHRGEIRAVNLINGSDRIIHSGLRNPSQVSVNWITQKLYWCDTILSTIEYSDFEGGNRQILLQNINGIETIALDPCGDYIYWISKERTYVIYKMKLDGTDKRTIVSSGLVAPNSLAIDFISSKLYWTDGSRLQTSNFEGGDRSTVYNGTTGVRRATGISFYGKALYWAEWKNSIIKTYTIDGTNVGTLVRNVKRTAAIHVMDKTRQLRCC